MTKKCVLLLLLCFVCSTAAAQISTVGSCSGTTSCASVPSHVAGDLFVVGVGRDASTTAPTIPAGYTAVTSALTINGTSTADSYFRVYCKVAAGSSETVTGFTSASAITVSIYRGNKPLVSTCADIFGTPVTSTTAINTTSTTVTFGSVTNTNSAGWDIGLAYTPAATAGLSSNPTGLTTRVTQGTVSTIKDTNAAVASYSTSSVTITTASRVLVATMEIKGPVAATPTFSPSSGAPPQTVTISSTTSGATICYTTNGTTPAATTAGTCSTGSTYSAPISVSSDPTTINAIATKSGSANSAVGTATYTSHVLCGNTATATVTGNNGNNGTAEIEPSCVTGANAAGYTVNNITVALVNPAITDHINCGIYTNVADPSKALVCSSGTTAMPAATGDMVIPISGCGTLAASTTYNIGCNMDNATPAWGSISNSGTDAFVSAAYPLLPNPYGTGSAQGRTNRWWIDVSAVTAGGTRHRVIVINQ